MSQYKGGVKNRQIRSLERLEKQLKARTKTEKVRGLTLYTTGANQVPLEEKDVLRIKKEIAILTKKLNYNG